MERDEIINKLQSAFHQMHEVKTFYLHGSLLTSNYDIYSDIDFIIDVSGIDNGKFMISLPDKLAPTMEIGYYAYAPRFAPELYLITIYFKNSDIFHFVDIECHANPHIVTLSKEELLKTTESIKLKLSLVSLKHILRHNEQPNEVELIYHSIYKHEQEVSTKSQLLKIFGYFMQNQNPIIADVARTANSMLQNIQFE